MLLTLNSYPGVGICDGDGSQSHVMEANHLRWKPITCDGSQSHVMEANHM